MIAKVEQARTRTMRELQLPDARNQFADVVEDAEAGEPSVITREGRPAAVLVGYEEWQRLVSRPSFADLLLAFPGSADDLPERHEDAPPLRAT
jgi:antitoxin Phd